MQRTCWLCESPVQGMQHVKGARLLAAYEAAGLSVCTDCHDETTYGEDDVVKGFVELGSAHWYFYRKANVVGYVFQILTSRAMTDDEVEMAYRLGEPYANMVVVACKGGYVFSKEPALP